MHAEQAMTAPVVTVHPETPVKEAAALLVTHGISGAPVVDADGGLVGMVTEADLIRLERTADPRSSMLRLDASEEPLPATVGQVMSREVVAVSVVTDIADVSRALLEHGIKAVPVLDGEKVVGIIARRDILRVVARRDDEIAADLRALLADDPQTYGTWSVGVKGGVATLIGPPQDAHRVYAELLSRTVAGLLAVRFVETKEQSPKA
jgi:CBS domain-containing protein